MYNDEIQNTKHVTILYNLNRHYTNFALWTDLCQDYYYYVSMRISFIMPSEAYETSLSFCDCLLKETWQWCQVSDVMLSDADFDLTYAGHNLLCCQLMTMLAKWWS